jgi:hypothetical protein
LLIAATGNGTGATYELLDPDGHGGHYYRLEDIDYSGKRTMHLPVQTEATNFDYFIFVPFIGAH